MINTKLKAQMEEILVGNQLFDCNAEENSACISLKVILAIHFSGLLKGGGVFDVLETLSGFLGNKSCQAKLHLAHRKEIFLLFLKNGYRIFFWDLEQTKSLLGVTSKLSGLLQISEEETQRQYKAIHPAGLTIEYIKNNREHIDSIMFGLVVSFFGGPNGINGYFKEDYEPFLRDSFFELLPIFKYYGFDEFRQTITNPVTAFLPKSKDSGENPWTAFLLSGQCPLIIDAWLNESSDPRAIFGDKEVARRLREDATKNNQLVMWEDGSVSTPTERLAFEKRKKFERALKTLSNMSGGIFGTIGYAIGGDEGSDIGATFDAIGSARLQVQRRSLERQQTGESLALDARTRMNKSAFYLNLTTAQRIRLRSQKPLTPSPKPLGTPRTNNYVPTKLTGASNRGLPSISIGLDGKVTGFNSYRKQSIYPTEFDVILPKVKIKGVEVNSYYSGFLLGDNRRKFMDDASKIARVSDVWKPLLTTGKLRSSYRTSKADWDSDPRIFEAGHARSARLGGKEFIVLMSAKYNRQFSANSEHPSAEGGMALSEAYVIDGIAVHQRTAWDLVDKGYIKRTDILNAQIIRFENFEIWR